MPPMPTGCAPSPFPTTSARCANDALPSSHRRRSAVIQLRFVPSAVAAIAGFALLFALPAQADVTIGVSLPLTGPTSALGIPSKNGIALWPKEVAGEKLNVIILDDATDPSLGVKNT